MNAAERAQEAAIEAMCQSLVGFVGDRPDAEQVIQAMPCYEYLSESQKKYAVKTARWVNEEGEGHEDILHFDLLMLHPVNRINLTLNI